LHDVLSGREILSISQPGYVHAFAPDGRSFATATHKRSGTFKKPLPSSATLHVWETASGKERLTLTSERMPEEGRFFLYSHVVFSPDGRLLSAARSDGVIQVWAVRTGRELISRDADNTSITCLAFSPDSRTIASGHADSTILIWSIPDTDEQRQHAAESR